MATHTYAASCTWTGNRGEGTRAYDAYDRSHRIEIAGKPVIEGSADPAFRGNPERLNPEELLIASISSCHMLWYLHLCADRGLVLTGYVDEASATMETDRTGGRFVEAVLKPRCTFDAPIDTDLAERLHETAHARCFVARSVNFPIRIEPVIEN